MSPELLAAINLLSVQADGRICGVDTETKLHARSDSFVVEINLKYPTNIGLLHDATLHRARDDAGSL